MTDQQLDLNDVQQLVRDRYAQAAIAASRPADRRDLGPNASCCGPTVASGEVEWTVATRPPKRGVF